MKIVTKKLKPTHKNIQAKFNWRSGNPPKNYATQDAYDTLKEMIMTKIFCITPECFKYWEDYLIPGKMYYYDLGPFDSSQQYKEAVMFVKFVKRNPRTQIPDLLVFLCGDKNLYMDITEHPEAFPIKSKENPVPIDSELPERYFTKIVR